MGQSTGDIQLKRNTTPGAEPQAGDLKDGELAMNLHDNKMWVGYGGAVQPFPSSGSVPPDGTMGWPIQADPISNPDPYDAWMNPANGLPYYYDPVRLIWVSLESVALHFSKNSQTKNSYLSIGEVNSSASGFVTPYPATIVSISGSITGGDNYKRFEIHENALSVGSFQMTGTNSYVDTTNDLRVASGTSVNVFCTNGLTVVDPQFLLRMKWYVLPI